MKISSAECFKQVEPILRAWVDHPRRWWIAITVTVVAGLIAVPPAVDEYTKQSKRRQELAQELSVATSEVALRDGVTRILSQRQGELETLHAMRFSPDDVQLFRNRVVELARDTDCQLRRIRLGNPSVRNWMANDHPLSWFDRGDAGETTPFELHTQQFSVSLTGSVTNITRFLERLTEQERMIHGLNFQLSRGSTDGKSATLELDLLMFDLARASKTSA